jgi:hypothetical protein
MTLATRLRYYLSAHDVMCESDVDRDILIKQCIEMYKKIAAQLNDPSYLDYMNNDIVRLIGYKVKLMEKQDLNGINLWNELDRRMYDNDVLTEEKVVELLYEVPLCFLLSFVGYASYREKVSDIL